MSEGRKSVAMTGVCVLSPDGGWNWLQFVLWLVAVPFVSAVLFVLAAFMAMIFRRRRGLFYSLFLWSAIVLGLYTAFNIADCFIYRYAGALAISPINQGVFQLFLSPEHLYAPYASAFLQLNKTEYELEFRPIYGGRQTVVLCVENCHPKEFDHDHPDAIGLSFTGEIEKGGEAPHVRFEKQYTTYFLMDGENKLPLFDYEIGRRSELKATNRVTVTITGDLDAFLRLYPGSYLCVKNGTTK